MNTIEKLGKMLREKQISARELTELYIDAVKRINPEINAFITQTEETAKAAAVQTDERIAKGESISAVGGIPFVLKDNIVTKGLKTTCASRMLAEHIPVYDATVWARLKDQNAVLLGKGNMDEFAMGGTGETSYYGGTINPHNREYVAGGSSSGVSAAVSGGISVFGIGSDTGGSIRQPASLCGVVGLKPTYGTVSRYGLVAFASSLDQIGPITVTARDSAIVFDAICQKDERDMTCIGGTSITHQLTGDISGLRLGIAREFYENLAPGVAEAVQRALGVLRDLGAELVDIDFPLLHSALPAYYVLACAEASSNLGRYDGLRYGHRAASFSDIDDFICRSRSEGFGAEVRRRILLGTCVLSTGYYDAYYNKALMLKNAISNAYERIFESCDCIVTPTVPVSGILRGAGQCLETYQSDICTVSVNIAGLPAISVPCGFDDGFPVGMQIISGRFCENKILNTAVAFESATDFAFVKCSEKGVVL